MASSFSADITKFVQKTKLSADLVLRKLVLDGYRGLLNRSPVLTGRFRGNWRVGVETPDLTTNEDKLPAGFNASTEEKIGTVRFGNTVYITNNLPYAQPIEHGLPGVKYADGRKAHSPQAPTGVLRNTFEELKNNFAATVRSVEEDT